MKHNTSPGFHSYWHWFHTATRECTKCQKITIHLKCTRAAFTSTVLHLHSVRRMGRHISRSPRWKKIMENRKQAKQNWSTFERLAEHFPTYKQPQEKAGSTPAAMVSIHHYFARKQVGDTQKRGKPEMQFMKKFTRFALLGLGPAQLRVCKCPPPQIPVSQSPF